MNPFIELRHITKNYENTDIEPVRVLKGIDLSLREGDFTAIMGPSGCGKSTLMNIVGLLDTPTSGEYYLNGKLVEYADDDALSVVRRDAIGFVFQ